MYIYVYNLEKLSTLRNTFFINKQIFINEKNVLKFIANF